MENCIFCYPDLDKNQKIILENDYCLYLQQEIQEIVGSGLIVPKAHKETLFDLSDKEWAATRDLLQQAKDYIDKDIKPDGYNVGWNCMEVGGQHIFHAHLHVIPRFIDEPMAGKGIRYLFKSKENQRPRIL
ncbi:diadenosine tetraphosphate (Ap4A) HIT family hydrolase [Fontibacillus phaseoli]|uniref:Diadenosine tetraphosphate (Ap4A) HIT family hydrolase n=1 Tax=Fontibacillus phaseoli TaxID=1416533 RepID=A0A369BJF9_9BACL|nr:HIT family protein [Fontibacillus phaseoli]RCX21531.1 diadenosine tetraphosphate (Ap4A) HIT family hydrolase [Fontibacillus phaseoli]